MKKRRVLLIANPAAGNRRGERLLVEAGQRLRQAGFPVITVLTEHTGHAGELARENAREHDLIAALGGDGTVNEVADGILAAAPENPPTLATIPVGTGNDAAQAFGMNGFDLAVEALAYGTTMRIDVLRLQYQCGKGRAVRHALLFAAIGFAAEIIRKTTPSIKRLFGPRYCYSIGFFRALLGFRAPEFRVKWSDGEASGSMFQVCAGNTEFAGGGVMRLSPGARPDDGLLNISLVSAMGRLEIVRQFPRVLSGAYVEDERVEYFTGTSLEIEAQPAAEIQVDGDIIGTTPVSIDLMPKALELVTPKSFR